jgi:hypothetical protein
VDLNGYWQENKRFVVTVGAGALAFVVAFWVETSLFQDNLNSTRREIQRYTNQLAEARYTSQDLADAERENEALKSAHERLVQAAAFHARPEFVADPAAGSAGNHYLRTLARVREDLMQRANRGGLEVDSSLGMPELSPTVESEIVRYLEALDLVESVADLALRARAKRIDKIQVRLDPAHATREGVGALERTRVDVSISGSSLALTRILAWSQRPPQGGRVLALDKFELLQSRSKRGEVRLDATFVVARVRPSSEAVQP